MTSETNNTESNQASEKHPPHVLKRPSMKTVVMWGVAAVIVLLALAFAKHQMDTRPKARRQKPPQQARLVTVETAVQIDYRTSVSAMGPVVPARQITLTPEVSGRVIEVSPLVIPGGAMEQGQVLVRIDSRDYEAVVKQRQSELARAELELKLEQGNQRVAHQEYQMLEDIVEDRDQELVLRQPHLEQARTALEAAQAALAKAELDVRRCTVTAPFNAVIQEKRVDVGAQVTPSSPLLDIMGTDEYWIRAKVNVDQLRWITFPDSDRPQGSAVRIFDEAAWGPGVWRQGQVLRLMGQLEEQGRLAQVLVSVKDPLRLESPASGLPPVLVDSYVRVEIEGKMLPSVFAVKRDYLHDGNHVWIMNDQDQMKILPVEIMFRDKDTVYLSDGIKPGDRIVTTDISAPVEGMPLRLNGASADAVNTEAQP